MRMGIKPWRPGSRGRPPVWAKNKGVVPIPARMRLSRRKQVELALRETYILLEGLRIGVEWELAPPIKDKIAEVAELVRVVLQQPSASRITP